jgi:hypothetical protein
MVYDAVRSGDEGFLPSRLIERSTAFSRRYAMTVIARPTSRRSIRRMNGLVEVAFVEALFVIGDRPYSNSGRNVHHRHNS